MRISRGIFRGPLAAVKRGVSAGLRPAPAEATSTSTSKAGYPWDGGVGPVAGDAVNPPPGSGPAAGGCAFGRLRSSASQAKRPHPWGLGRGIHAADTPATGPIPPSTISGDLSDLIRFISISDRCVDQGRHLPTAQGICQRRGGVGVRGVSRMDAAAKPTRTYLRRPRNPTPHRKPTECPLLLLLWPLQVQGAALPKPAQP